MEPTTSTVVPAAGPPSRVTAMRRPSAERPTVSAAAAPASAAATAVRHVTAKRVDRIR
jgi:hypothetical protein